MDWFQECVEKTKDPNLCTSLKRIGELTGVLVDCVKVLGVDVCFHVCLKKCQGEGCEAACLNALETALGIVEARRIARGASLVTVLLGVDPTYAVATAFEAELQKAEKMECPQKAIAGRILAAAAVELHKSFQRVPSLQKDAQDVLTLMAPALALAYQCVREVVFEYLELARPFIGEDATRRIVAALEEGGVLVGGATIQFKPVKVRQ
jgi:hypothetical protein